ASPRPPTDTLPGTPFAFVGHYLVRGFLGHLVVLAVLVGLSAAIETSQTYVLGQLVNGLNGLITHPGLLANPAARFGLLFTTWLFGYHCSHTYSTYSTYLQMSLRVRIHDELFGYLHGHAPRYFLDHASGALAQKVRQAAMSAGVIIDYVSVNIVRFA